MQTLLKGMFVTMLIGIMCTLLIVHVNSSLIIRELQPKPTEEFEFSCPMLGDLNLDNELTIQDLSILAAQINNK